MSVDMILDILIIACGGYMIYKAVQMNRTKQIPEMLVGKDFPIERSHDQEGFIRAVFPITAATGATLVLTGLIGALELLASYPVADVVINLLEVAVILLYGALLLKAQQKYLAGE